MKIDTILINGRIRTLDDRRPTATSIGILGGRVVGLDEQLDGVRADRVIDLGGAPVVPGFNDAHLHFSMLGREMTQLDLSIERVPTLEALYAAVSEYAAGRPEGAWVVGNGYDQNKLGAHPRREELDKVAGGRPVLLVHCSNHMAVANTRAFEVAGHSNLDALHDVPGGSVIREHGVVTGLLQENAMTLVNHVRRPVPQDEIVDAIEAASGWAARHGLTSVTEPGISGEAIGHGPADLRAFQTARDRGVLSTRLTLMPFVDTLHSLGPIEPGRDGYGLDLGLRSGFGNEWLRIGAVKIASDGSLIGRTARMCCDYDDEPGNQGMLRMDEDVLRQRIIDLHANGFQVATHAIGDGALDLVIDAYAEAQRLYPRHDPRHRIEHTAVASDAQVARIVAGGLIPVPQGRFLSALGDGFLAALGEDRVQLAYRMRSFVDAGVELPGSTDAPVVPGEPLISIHDMVNRRTSGGALLNQAEALTAAQALRAYTIGSAYASHQEGEKGMLLAGMLADLVVLSDDILAVKSASIRDLEVAATIVDGVVEYDAAGAFA